MSKARRCLHRTAGCSVIKAKHETKGSRKEAWRGRAGLWMALSCMMTSLDCIVWKMEAITGFYETDIHGQICILNTLLLELRVGLSTWLPSGQINADIQTRQWSQDWNEQIRWRRKDENGV